MRQILLLAAVTASALLAQPARACPYEDLVKSYYHRYLGRCPQPCEVNEWVGHLRRGAPAEKVEVGFLSSEEYWCKSGRCNEGFVRSLYRDVLGRETCRQEMATWLDAMRCGCRVKVATKFLCEARRELAQRPPQPPPSRVIAPGPLVVPQQGYQEQPPWSSGYRGRPAQESDQRVRIIYVR